MDKFSPRREILKGGLASLASLFVLPFGRRNTYPDFYNSSLVANQLLHQKTQSVKHEENEVVYFWSGALTPTSIKINVRLIAGALTQIKYVSAAGEEKLSEPVDLTLINSFDNYIATFELTDLVPNMGYKYWVVMDGIEYNLEGSFTTPADGPFSFKVAFGNCSRTGSTSKIYSEILEKAPLMFMHLGDFHYENIKIAAPYKFREAYRRVLTSTTQSELYHKTPVMYIWDDHDYGGNNTNSESKSAKTAQDLYRQCVPHYPLVKPEGAIYQSFRIGRIKFVVTDGRSNRDPDTEPDNESKSMLGKAQKEWLKDELLRGKFEGPLTVWVNNVSWISSADPDTWAGYQTERAEIATFIEENEIENIAMLCGDAHILAMDDGSNNRYGAQGKRLFPVFHAGPLDSTPVFRGGPYTQLAPLENGNYGMMEVVDTGNGIDIYWSGYSVSSIEEEDRTRDSQPDPDSDIEAKNQLLTFAFSMPEPEKLASRMEHRAFLPLVQKD